MNPELVLKQNNIELPIPHGPIGSYIPYNRVGNIIYFSGQGPLWNNEVRYAGKIGRDLTKEEGYQAARLTGLNIIALIKQAIGDLNKVKKFVNVIGFVNCTNDFINQPYILNGFSDLMIEIFGQKGYHARCAVPSGTLPMNTSVEIQVIIEVEEQ